jgi:sec-independent protein translocase protein TatA
MQQVVAQSFLGVGAPEAILVAVVALVVFGPKGLADVSEQQQQQ